MLLQKRLEKEQSDERAEAKKRFDEAEARGVGKVSASEAGTLAGGASEWASSRR